MGLFDGWRRKKSRPPVRTRPREARDAASEKTGDDHADASTSKDRIASLLNEYNTLSERRDALSLEREELTLKLENGEIEATQFRKELMLRIQEASKVSESMRETTAQLSELGYQGTLQ